MSHTTEHSRPGKGSHAHATPQPEKPKAPTVDKTVVFVSNLPFEVSDHFVADAFWQGGQLEVASVDMLYKGLPGGHKKTCGLATVKLKSETDAQLALHKLDGYEVLGRPMIIRADKFVADDPTYVHGQEPAAAPADGRVVAH